MAANLKRLRLLFAPQTCLVNKFEKRLKEAFIENFVKMNVHFEEMLTGDFHHEDDWLRATPEGVRKQVLTESGFYSEVASVNKSKVEKKYERTGRLLAGAHAKWLICDAADEAVEMEFGKSDKTFRTATSYGKWIPEAKKQEGLQCTIFDSSTGCLKCITGKFSAPHRCPLEGNIKVEEVWKDVQRKHAPLNSAYHKSSKVSVKANSTSVSFTKAMGFCLGGLETARSSFAGAMKFEKVFRVEQVSEVGAFSIQQAPPAGLKGPTKLSQCLEEGGNTVWPHQENSGGFFGKTYSSSYVSSDPMGEKAKVQQCLDRVEGKHFHPAVHQAKDFGPMFVFEEYVAEENNVEAHYVQYINSCPCSGDDDDSNKKIFASFNGRFQQGDQQEENEYSYGGFIREYGSATDIDPAVRLRLFKFYKQNKPEKIREIDTLLRKYRGKEEVMFKVLDKKYGSATVIDPAVRLRLLKFYEQYQPEKISQIDTLLQKYRGKEEVMFKVLDKKYKGK